ncbi:MULTISPECIES: lysozyme inhibitor LprI family protein [unclassified Pseudomonas]|uniref:lysozyme inhibitor LprI family protein n=1 Tax=unclassified Pseudomonas TaxID=196821 RepID=UPI002AC8D607|nr:MULTISPECIES: lysozyme inhibitor LprI family protein [unclassified Pseudomonas]MEB0043807.1 DUF1311 domain-containing protein [Pseudomonas sp. Dout3]MEB0095255.1 DUF1311 domain-containing protein [Pseudomonas sp. DC1.2]WPX58811.1 lysozyme inhibitor LprI family protein [Pseudomonas sp. DC1.2]
MLKRFVLGLTNALIAFVLLPVSAAFAQDDCSETTSSLGVSPCSEAAKNATDSQLNTSYHQLMGRLESQYLADPKLGEEYSAMLNEPQRAWIKLRDTNCAVEAFEIDVGKPAYYQESVELLNAVIARNPARTVAYLNLADSYWGLKDKKQAAQAYKQYATLMSGAGKASKIPARVAERSD